MKYKLKQLIYVKEVVFLNGLTHDENREVYCLGRVTQASSDPEFIYITPVGIKYSVNIDEVICQISDYPSKRDPVRPILVAVSRVFDKQAIDLLYGS